MGTPGDEMTQSSGGPLRSYRPAPNVLTAVVGEDLVILNPNTGQYHLLNSTGRLLLKGLEDQGSLESAAKQVATSTAAELETVMADAKAFLDSMLERGLIIREE